MELTREYFEEYLEKQLKNMATKDDLRNFATKDDFQHLNVRLNSIELRLDVMNEKIDRIGSRDEEDIKAIIKTQHNHEHRLKALEKVVKR